MPNAALNMRYTAWDLKDLARTTAGRRRLIEAFNYLAFPGYEILATMYRRVAVRRPRIICTVGSKGKSTTRNAVAAVLGLGSMGRTHFNSWSHVARAVLRIRPRSRHAVIEVGIAKPGQMRRYAAMLKPDLTIVTSVGSDHNRSLPRLEVTRTEKAEMVRVLSPAGVAVLNGDDPNVIWMKTQTRARIVTYGFDPSNDVRAGDYVLDWPYGSRFSLQADGQARPVRCRLVGRHMIYPILAAVAVGRTEGMTLDDVVRTLESVPPLPGRLKPIRLPNGAWVLSDEFKSPLESMSAALEVMAELPNHRRIVVFGEVTEPQGSQHTLYKRLGRRIGQVASKGIILGEKFDDYLTGAVQAGMPKEAMTNGGRSVRKALEILKAELRAGDVVLIKGRGNQKLRRIILGLQGRQVRCDTDCCHLNSFECDDCGMLERGWDGLRIVT